MRRSYPQREEKEKLKKTVQETIGKNQTIKLIASAQNKGSKCFWRAVKALSGDSEKPNKTEQSIEISYKQLSGTADIKKCEILKTYRKQ